MLHFNFETISILPHQYRMFSELQLQRGRRNISLGTPKFIYYERMKYIMFLKYILGDFLDAQIQFLRLY